MIETINSHGQKQIFKIYFLYNYLSLFSLESQNTNMEAKKNCYCALLDDDEASNYYIGCR